MTNPSPGTAGADAVSVEPIDLTTSDPGSALPALTPSGRIYDSLANVRTIEREMRRMLPARGPAFDHHGSA